MFVRKRTEYEMKNTWIKTREHDGSDKTHIKGNNDSKIKEKIVFVKNIDTFIIKSPG